MKQPKKLTREQKEHLRNKGMDPADYMMSREFPNSYLLKQKSTGQPVVVEK